VSVRLLEPDLRMYAGEQRGLLVEVRNTGNERWPGGLEAEPRIRLSCRLDGQEGPRTPLPAALDPSESGLAPVTVIAPDEPGSHELELDLVHEDVRWLGAGTSAELEVVSRGETERALSGPFARRFKRRRIPRILHRVWLGSRQLPEEQQAFGASWAAHHPSWEHRLWGDDDLAWLGIDSAAFERAPDASTRSDIVRHHVLARLGGVYADTDVECLRPLDSLLRGVSAFGSFGLPGIVETSVLGCVPGHPAFCRAAELSLVVAGTPSPQTGPPFLTHVLWAYPDVTVFPREHFSPYLWDEPQRRDEQFPDAYAVHHWAKSWADPKK
jgi:Glycosyltransferase sugar-binding region containing DXD motif